MRLQREDVEIRRTDFIHALDKTVHIAPAAPIAAGLQQVAANGDRLQAQADDIGEIALVDAARKRDREAIAERPPEPVAPTRSPAGAAAIPERYISGSLAGKKLLWFSTTSVLENLTPRPRPSASACGAETLHHRDDLPPFGVLDEGAIGNNNPCVAHAVVENGAELFAPEQGRIELDDDVEAEFAEQDSRRCLRSRREGSRGTWRASAYRKCASRTAGRADRRQGVGDLRRATARRLASHPSFRRGNGAHLGRADAGEVVADAHVEHSLLQARRDPEAFSISISIEPLTYSSSDWSMVSSCDHSTLKPTVAMSMHGRGMTSRLSPERSCTRSRGRLRATTARCSAPSACAGRRRARTASRPGADGGQGKDRARGRPRRIRWAGRSKAERFRSNSPNSRPIRTPKGRGASWTMARRTRKEATEGRGGLAILLSVLPARAAIDLDRQQTRRRLLHGKGWARPVSPAGPPLDARKHQSQRIVAFRRRQSAGKPGRARG